MSNILFIYKGSPTYIQVESTDFFRDIFKKYAFKTFIDLKETRFLYEGNEINENLQVQNFIGYGQVLKVIVQNIKDVQTKTVTDTGDNSETKLNPNLKLSDDIICPTCHEECVIKIDEFKVSLEESRNGHKFSDMPLIDFNKTQYIDKSIESNITCSECKNKRSEFVDVGAEDKLYKCLECNSPLCSICMKNKHDKSHQNMIFDYGLEKYLCKAHKEKIIFYCETCKENICDLCAYDHYEKDHKILYLKEIFEDRNIEDNLNDFILKLEKCKKEMETMLNKIKTVYNNLDTYYRIANNLMTTYNQRHKNLITVKSINNLNNFSKSFIGEIEKINQSQFGSKMEAIFELYDRLKIPDTKENKDHSYIRYKIGKKRRFRIFGDEFVKNNKDNCKIIFNEKEQDLNAFFDLKDIKIKDQILEIKLKEINNLKNLSHMFNECSSLIELPSDFSSLKTENETNFSYMFNNCCNVSIPDISQWDTKNIKDMSYMFCNCSSLKLLPNLSKWNTDNLTDLTGMFQKCSSLTSFPDISNWNTGNVTSMKCLFNECSKLWTLFDISKWDTKSVTNMNAMFEKCSALPSMPDISKWNTENVKDISYMFNNCSLLLEFPNISNWNIKNVINKENMFNECPLLKNIPSFIKSE